jgi:hypothetical protein
MPWLSWNGHARHSSPVSSGIVGECQHCQDDCQCLACQSTYHSVRCCFHEDHKAIIHHHRAPRKELTTPNPPRFLVCPPGGDGTTQKGPLPCPARSADRVNPPRAELYAKFNPPTLTELPKTAIPHNFFPMPLTVGKTPPLPRSNHFKAKKAGPKPPTPYPFISTSKSKPKAVSAAATTEYPHPRITERPSTVAAYPSSLKEGSRLPSLALSYAQSQVRSSFHTVDTRITTHCGHDIEHNQEHRESAIHPSTKYRASRKSHTLPTNIVSALPVQTSPSGSGKASRRFSALFELGDTALNQKLLDHQEQWRQIEKECDERIDEIARKIGGIISLPSGIKVPEESQRIQGQIDQVERAKSTKT